MTLIVGIKTTGGIVIGADSAQTMAGYTQQPTKKLAIIGDHLVVGSAGSGSLAHQLQWALTSLVTTGQFQAINIPTATNILTRTMLGVVQGHLQNSAALRQYSMAPQNYPDHSIESLVAFPIADTVRLFNFNTSSMPIEITDAVCFGSLGIGVYAANPMLSLFQRIWWAGNQPSLADGIVATTWVLNHAILTSSGGVADPKLVVTLSQENNQWVAKELTEDELNYHGESIDRMEAFLGEKVREFLDTERQAHPLPAPPPACATQP